MFKELNHIIIKSILNKYLMTDWERFLKACNYHVKIILYQFYSFLLYLKILIVKNEKDFSPYFG
jgi:hypothetical protein